MKLKHPLGMIESESLDWSADELCTRPVMTAASPYVSEGPVVIIYRLWGEACINAKAAPIHREMNSGSVT